MTLILELAPDEHSLLEAQAQDAGLSSHDYARRVLLGDAEQTRRRLKARRGVALLQSWMDEATAPDAPDSQDAAHWREALRDVDEQRGGRRLFDGQL